MCRAALDAAAPLLARTDLSAPLPANPLAID